MIHIMRFLITMICLCTIAGLPLPLSVLLVSPQAVEAESSGEDKVETSGEEVVAGSSVRRRVRTVGKTRLCLSTDVAGGLRGGTSYARQLPARVGHQLPNGLRAPLLL